MNLLRTFARQDNIFLPVIHVVDEDQAVRNVRIAQDSGADGVWLINHAISYSQLLSVDDHVRGEFPDLWIGLNCLDLGLNAIKKISLGVPGLWADDLIVTEDGETLNFHRFNMFRTGKGWNGLFFGSVAFKTHGETWDVEKAATLACEHTDIITTSGPQTGEPPSVEKIVGIRKVIGDHPLAIASGMTAENVLDYTPFANIFMVATGISESFYELCPRKTLAFGRRLGE